MKYIKTYEIKKYTGYLYNIGDYVKVRSLISYVRKNIYVVNDRYNDGSSNCYFIIRLNSDEDINYLHFWEIQSNLMPLTPKELEQIEIELAAKKYNI